MYPALVTKTPDRRNSGRYSVFIVNFEQMRHLGLVFPFLT